MTSKPLLLTLGLLLFLPGLVRSEERSVIVCFKRQPGRYEHALIHRAGGKVCRCHQLIPAMTATLPVKEIEKLRKNSRIAYVETDAIYTIGTASVQAGSELDNSWGVPHIFADRAHAAGNKGRGVKIAILDSGIDYTHEDLDDNYLGGYDFVFDDNDPYDDNFQSHGTHVAGIIAAEANGFGAVGVAPEADILAVKVLDGAGFGTEDWIIAGIDWAVQNGADIINLSIQGPDRQGLRDACDRAREAGVLLVAASGNSLAGGGTVQYPAGYDSVIAVTATDRANMPGRFSPIGDALELAAPGVDIFSTVAGGDYDLLDGTSQAAPHVTGAAALYMPFNTKDRNGDGKVDSEDLRLMLRSTATDLGDAGPDDATGYGLVNAGEAVSGGGDDDDSGLPEIDPRQVEVFLNALFHAQSRRRGRLGWRYVLPYVDTIAPGHELLDLPWSKFVPPRQLAYLRQFLRWYDVVSSNFRSSSQGSTKKAGKSQKNTRGTAVPVKRRGR